MSSYDIFPNQSGPKEVYVRTHDGSRMTLDNLLETLQKLKDQGIPGHSGFVIQGTASFKMRWEG